MQISKKSLIWGGLSLFLFYLFYALIPLDIYSSFFYLFVIVGSIGTTVCFLLFVIHTFFGKPEDPEKDPKNDYSGYLFAAIIIFGVFGLGFLFVDKELDRESEELSTNGHYTTARVVDGSSYTSRKHDFSSLEILYLDASNVLQRSSISVSKNEFNNFVKFQDIRIKVSKRYPKIIQRVSESEYLMHVPDTTKVVEPDTVITDPRERMKKYMESHIKGKK